MFRVSGLLGLWGFRVFCLGLGCWCLGLKGFGVFMQAEFSLTSKVC